jgi:hypothetical protein
MCRIDETDPSLYQEYFKLWVGQSSNLASIVLPKFHSGDEGCMELIFFGDPCRYKPCTAVAPFADTQTISVNTEVPIYFELSMLIRNYIS